MVGRRNIMKHEDKEKDSRSTGHEDHRGSNARLRGKDRFMDVARSVVADVRRDQMKKKLIEGVNEDNLERYRKSDDEVCQSNKHAQ